MYLKFQFVINFFFCLWGTFRNTWNEWSIKMYDECLCMSETEVREERKWEREGWCYDDTTLSSSKKIHIFIHIFRIAYFTWRYKYRYVNIGIIRIIYIYIMWCTNRRRRIFSRVYYFDRNRCDIKLLKNNFFPLIPRGCIKRLNISFDVFPLVKLNSFIDIGTYIFNFSPIKISKDEIQFRNCKPNIWWIFIG